MSFALRHGPNTAPHSVWPGFRRIILFKEDLEKKQPSFKFVAIVNIALWCFQRVSLDDMVLPARLAQFGRAAVE
jgi:hypothetical protein